MLGTDIRGIMAEEEEVQRRQEALRSLMSRLAPNAFALPKQQRERNENRQAPLGLPACLTGSFTHQAVCWSTRSTPFHVPTPRTFRRCRKPDAPVSENGCSS